MLVPKEKVNEAKELYGDKAIQKIVDYFQIENFDEKNGKCSCPLGHEDKTPSFIWNPKNNSFRCFSCGRNFDIIDLYQKQGMTYLESIKKLFEETNISHTFGEMGVSSKQSYKYPKHEYNENRTAVESYLSLRKISKDTLDYADVQADAHNNIVFHYCDSNDVLCLVKYRPSRKVTKGESKSWCQKDSDTTPLLYNMNRIDPSKTLVITEGEIDTLSIIEAGYMNVVSIPLGAQNYHWIEENWDWLEQFSKIIIWSDNDEPGIKMRKEACYRLGSWRTYYIELELLKPNSQAKCKDANEVLYYYGKEKVLEIINNPMEIPVEHMTDLSEATDYELDKIEGLYTGIKTLDDKIYKLLFGTVFVVSGYPGSGKSVFVNQLAICQALQQGYDTFVFSGELPASLLKNWVEINMIGRENIKVKDGHVRVLDKEKRSKMTDWYKGRVWVYDDSYDCSDVAILDKMEEMARKFGTKVFMIDNLMMVDFNCDGDDKWEAQKQFVKKLIAFAKKYNVIVFLVAHPKKPMQGSNKMILSDIAGVSDIGNLCHYSCYLHRYTDEEKAGEMGKNNQYLKGCEPKEADSCVTFIKNRITGELPKVDLKFDYVSYRFYDTPSELWMRYKWNKDTSSLRTDDPRNKDKSENSPL